MTAQDHKRLQRALHINER